MAFETNDPATELRNKARDMFPYSEELARSTYHWNAADEIERLQTALKPFAHYFDLNDCEGRPDDDVLEVPIGHLRNAARALHDTSGGE